MRDPTTSNMFQGTMPQLIAVFCGTLGAISDGMHYGWTAPVLQVLESPSSPVAIAPSDRTWLESVYMIGGITGLPVTILTVDKIGRKKMILMSALVSAVAWLLIGFADRALYLYAARFAVGLSGDVAFVAAPMYIAEIADQKIRGFLSGMIYLMMLVGVLIIYAVAPFTAFYVPSVIGVAISVMQLVSFPFVPDSPYYLISKGEHAKARKNLARLRSDDRDVDKELAEITAAVKRQRSERGRPQDLLISKSNRKAVIIMLVLNAAQHFSGISVLLMNLHGILTAAGSTYLSSEAAGIVFAATMLVAATAADFLVDRFGRRSLLTASSVLTGTSLLVLAVYFTVKSNGCRVDTISWIPVVSVMVYAAVFKFGLGIIPIVMTAELFPAKVKAMGMTVADFFYVFFGLISIELFAKLVRVSYYDVPFYIFAASCLLTAAFSQWYIPETKGKTLEEIQFMLKGETVPAQAQSVEGSTTINKLSSNDKDISDNDVPIGVYSVKL